MMVRLIIVAIAVTVLVSPALYILIRPSHGFGNQQFGFPIGQASVSVAGQAEAVTIQDGKITDF
jgi:hypothetical protein